VKYSEKLKDPRWQRKRLEVLSRDCWACLACGDKTQTLQVHHKEYHGDPWDAGMDSLETLCESCHELRSNVNKLFLSLRTKDALSCWPVIGNKRCLPEGSDLRAISDHAIRICATLNSNRLTGKP
jgi:hypothetical protein